jgi:diacylglycerol kinase (ATP)
MATLSPDGRAERVRIILNPKAGAGRAGRGVDRLKRAADAVLGDFSLVTTEAPGHATVLAREAVDAGMDLIVAVGGDGTCHEVVNGLFEGDVRRGDGHSAFGLLPFGTGSDLQRSLEVPADLDAALRILATGETRACDVGLAELQRNNAHHRELFINVAGFGANGEVVRRANQKSKRLGGKATFFLSALQTTFSFAPGPMRLRWRSRPDGPEEHWEGRALSCFVANGAYCGGGMWVGKGGSLDDGLLDITLLPPDAPLTQVLRSRRLYDGSVDRWPGARRMQVSELVAEPADDRRLYVDLDGEGGCALPARFSVLPGCLPIRGGWAR